MLCSKTYCQSNPQIKISVINSDTVFIFNRDYAKYIVGRLDSLNHYKNSFTQSLKVIEECSSLNNKYSSLIDLKESEIVSLNKQILYCDELSESYYKSEQINDALQKSLKSQLKRTKVRTILAITGVSFAGLSTILYFLK